MSQGKDQLLDVPEHDAQEELLEIVAKIVTRQRSIRVNRGCVTDTFPRGTHSIEAEAVLVRSVVEVGRVHFLLQREDAHELAGWLHVGPHAAVALPRRAVVPMVVGVEERVRFVRLVRDVRRRLAALLEDELCLVQVRVRNTMLARCDSPVIGVVGVCLRGRRPRRCWGGQLR